MIDKFLAKYDEFASHDGIADLSDEVKVSLFGVFLQALKPRQPSKSNQSSQSSMSKSDRSATEKQVRLIKQLVRQGQLDSNADYSDLSVKEASAVINTGVNNKPSGGGNNGDDSDGDDNQKSGDFTGSYNHKSDGAASQAFFWE